MTATTIQTHPGRRRARGARSRGAAAGSRRAGYAASALATGYAVLVRGYQGVGGTLGLPGRLEDPAGMQRASLLAGSFLLVVGIGALAFVRPWGLRLPRWLVIAPALVGSAFAGGHALVAYITKPLHAAGAIDLQFKGWAHVSETGLILWDVLFYEPWFLALAVSTTLGALHHHRRTGGSLRTARRLLAATVAGAIVLGLAGSLSVAQ